MSLVKQILNFLLPPHCPICHARLQDEFLLCGPCFSGLKFINNHICSLCGREILSGKMCGECLRKSPKFDKCLSVFQYNTTIKSLILPFKHADHQELAPLFVKWLILKGKPLIEECDVLIPVPLHARRLFKRKYNQSALLAQKLAQHFKKEYQPLVLKRKRNTPSQGHLNKQKRQENIRGAFYVATPEKIQGKKILLIDDVYTTGATLNECAKVLKKAKVQKVYCLTLCRAGK